MISLLILISITLELLILIFDMHLLVRAYRNSEDPVRILPVDPGSSFHFINAYEYTEGGKNLIVVGEYGPSMHSRYLSPSMLTSSFPIASNPLIFVIYTKFNVWYWSDSLWSPDVVYNKDEKDLTRCSLSHNHNSTTTCIVIGFIVWLLSQACMEEDKLWEGCASIKGLQVRDGCLILHTLLRKTKLKLWFRYEFEYDVDGGEITYKKKDLSSAAYVELPSVSPKVSCSKVLPTLLLELTDFLVHINI